METVVRRDTSEGLEEFLDRAGWYHLDGIELDLSGMSEADYQRAAGVLSNAALPVRSVHYDRTGTVSLQERELFRSQLEMVVGRADDLGCDLISVHPPEAEVGETHTVRDLQGFLADVDRFAADQDVQICFELTGFMTDPEMVNIGFAELAEPNIGAMADVADMVDGIDPTTILAKVAVGLWKVKVPMPAAAIGSELDLPGDVVVVADGLE